MAWRGRLFRTQRLPDPSSLGSLTHAWSLSIEEQFYFVWPWIVVGAIYLARRSHRMALIAITTVGIVTIGLARRIAWIGNMTNAMSGTDKVDAWVSFYRSSLLRPDGLLFGCLLAVLLSGVTITRRVRRFAVVPGVISLIAATFIVTSAEFQTWKPWVSFIPSWGLSLFNLAVMIVVAWLVVSPRTAFARLLSLGPLRWTGRRAYGIYLLHFVLILPIAAHTHVAGARLDVVVVGATLIAAGLSFRFIESPFLRLKERFSSRSGRAEAAPNTNRRRLQSTR